MLFFDGSGMCLFYKRLDRGTFRLPDIEVGATSVAIDERALDDLLDGIDAEAQRKTPASFNISAYDLDKSIPRPRIAMSPARAPLE